ncbi:hypothetical protein BCR41DRAFT_375180 [Lobosporangium transversale]|uniref:Uncharacterized protein n=1 Tax=Lobosporangium transversale TaxID=64571 RepID=A0A1Y2G7X5_9FUNG|nr:hypothetical protein BCR41DRAFT_375180 [Lobosporangium transversale]ORZ01948.1 hypothetical protein BCR41DRAFT_375180 [Lobosporangium transversale]|eukprot:XP_021876201.1 hypothetical protein BCR41DRAFT_375180 [Lobosporangium transversale]
MLLLRNAEGVGGTAVLELASSCGFVVSPAVFVAADVDAPVAGVVDNENKGADVAADEQVDGAAVEATFVVPVFAERLNVGAAVDDAAVEAAGAPKAGFAAPKAGVLVVVVVARPGVGLKGEGVAGLVPPKSGVVAGAALAAEVFKLSENGDVEAAVEVGAAVGVAPKRPPAGAVVAGFCAAPPKRDDVVAGADVAGAPNESAGVDVVAVLPNSDGADVAVEMPPNVGPGVDAANVPNPPVDGFAAGAPNEGAAGAEVVVIAPKGLAVEVAAAGAPKRDGAAAEDVNVDPNPPVDAGVDPNPPVGAGVDPNPPVDAGVDPNPPVDAGVDPNPPRDADVDPNPPVDVGVDPNVVPEPNDVVPNAGVVAVDVAGLLPKAFPSVELPKPPVAPVPNPPTVVYV